MVKFLPVTAPFSSLDKWAAQVRAGDVRAISRAVTAIEDRRTEAENLLRLLFPHTGHAYKIGVTGAPGTGKSTLVDRLAANYRAEQKTVGIIAVDPSSPLTGGAILGDRIRMQAHGTDEGMFIRSMATRGSLGGLAQATGDTALLLDAAGKDAILIETVGVGQAEIDVVRLADCTLVIVVPGMGDDVQSLKAGLMEIGDIFVLNKSDYPGAERYEQQLSAILQMAEGRNGWQPPVVRTVASENRGIEEVAHQIERFRAHGNATLDRSAREVKYWKQRLECLLLERVIEQVKDMHATEAKLDDLAAEVAARRKDPYAAVDEIFRRAGLGAQK